jgi:hypothetical protein
MINIIILNEVVLETGEQFLVNRIFRGSPSNQLHFEIVNESGEWQNHRSFSVEEISTIRTVSFTF